MDDCKPLCPGVRCAFANQEVLFARQGLTLVHFSAQPEPFLVTGSAAAVNFSAQPETFLLIKLPK